MSYTFHKIVHLDLKGAPWQVDYLTRVIKVVKKWGATGILFEWEDTFPFTDNLTCIGSLSGSNLEGVYSPQEVQQLLKVVKEQNLVPIQLVQTFGHMEYVLKHPPFIRLRELPLSPAVLCPSLEESKDLVQSMVTQILNAQPDAEYIHIGADEVWHMDLCMPCRDKSGSHRHGSLGLYFDHITRLAKYILEQRPGITILMWDDMIRNVDEKILEDYKISELITPVVWKYEPAGKFQLDESMWTRYIHVFPNVWVGSAFKGADGSCKIVAPVARYVSNQEAWIEEVKTKEQQITFGGVIFTGWSRYDHYAMLCELLPVSLPSLASCLKMWNRKEQVPTECVVHEELPSHQWPGESLARSIYSFVLLRDRIRQFLDGDHINTWMNPWQVEHEYLNPLRLHQISWSAQLHLTELSTCLDTLTLNMTICGPRSSQEWISMWGLTLKDKLNALLTQCTGKTIAPISPRNKSESAQNLPALKEMFDRLLNLQIGDPNPLPH